MAEDGWSIERNHPADQARTQIRGNHPRQAHLRVRRRNSAQNRRRRSIRRRLRADRSRNPYFAYRMPGTFVESLPTSYEPQDRSAAAHQACRKIQRTSLQDKSGAFVRSIPGSVRQSVGSCNGAFRSHRLYVVIAGDRTPISSSDSVEALFFGRRAEFPSGGALLALLLKRPLRAMICTRDPEAPSGYLVTFHSIDESPSAPRSHRREWISDKMQIWAGLLEDRLKQSPYDWFNFYNFWRSK